MGRTPTILVVEDDAIVLEMLVLILEEAGLRVLQARDSDEAEQLWHEERDSIDLLLTDVNIPFVPGHQLARQFKLEKPELRVVISSGSIDLETFEVADLLGAEAMLQKPYRPQMLLDAVFRQLKPLPISKKARSAGTILVLEDDDRMRQIITDVLEDTGYRVLAAADGNGAAELWNRERNSIDLLLADILMPGLSGPEIAREFLQSRPELKVIFMTGSRESIVLNVAETVDTVAFLPKPFNRSTLLNAVAKALGFLGADPPDGSTT